MALGGADGYVRLVDARTGAVEVWSLTSRTHITLASDPLEGASGLAISPNGSTLASVAGCQLRFWDPATGGAIGQPADLDYVVAHGGGDTDCGELHTQLSFAADGSLVVNLNEAGPVYVWSPLHQSTSTATLARAICAIVNSNLSRAEYSAVLPAAPYHRTCA